jgi:hypothetical protein
MTSASNAQKELCYRAASKALLSTKSHYRARAKLRPGKYTNTLSPCSFMPSGCKVKAGFSTKNLSIYFTCLEALAKVTNFCLEFCPWTSWWEICSGLMYVQKLGWSEPEISVMRLLAPPHSHHWHGVLPACSQIRYKEQQNRTDRTARTAKLFREHI